MRGFKIIMMGIYMPERVDILPGNLSRGKAGIQDDTRETGMTRTPKTPAIEIIRTGDYRKGGQRGITRRVFLSTLRWTYEPEFVLSECVIWITQIIFGSRDSVCSTCHVAKGTRRAEALRRT